MTQIINLNRARKDRARAEKRRQGDANAAKHGRSKAERTLAEAQALRATRTLDQHRRNDAAVPRTDPQDSEDRDGA